MVAPSAELTGEADGFVGLIATENAKVGLAIGDVSPVAGIGPTKTGGRGEAGAFREIELGVAEGGGINNLLRVEVGESARDNHGALRVAAEDELGLGTGGADGGDVGLELAHAGGDTITKVLGRASAKQGA